jgi:hypothetical protein
MDNEQIDVNSFIPGFGAEYIGSVSFNGLSAYCYGYALNSIGELVYLTMISPQVAVRGVWAALMEGRYNAIEVAGIVLRRNMDVKYVKLETPLAAVQQRHMVIVHPHAICKRLGQERGAAQDSDRALNSSQQIKEFYLLARDAEHPHIELFFSMLNEVIAIPMQTEWATWMWEQGQRPRRLGGALIKRLKDCRGVAAWRVLNDEDTWLRMIQFKIASENEKEFVESEPDPTERERYPDAREDEGDGDETHDDAV